jgi:radical SAM-linked protein
MQTTMERPGHTSEHDGPPDTVAFCFTLDHDLRSLSHHDELRMLARALTRARWPLAYSRGFNPRPRIVLPLPRSVGVASDCQWAVVRLNQTHPLADLHDSLAAVLPAACRLRQVAALPTRAMPRPSRVVFETRLEPPDADAAALRIAAVLTAETLPVERAYGPNKPSRVVDIRPYIETITLAGCRLSMRLVFVHQRTARPSEVVTALNLPTSIYNHRLRQVEVAWDMALAGPTQGLPGAERNNVGPEESRHAKTKSDA